MRLPEDLQAGKQTQTQSKRLFLCKQATVVDWLVSLGMMLSR